MPNDALTAAIKEAYASAQKNVAILDTLEVSHPDGGTFYLVNNQEDLSLTDEDTNTNTFTATSFRIQRPKQGETGAQELTVQIDNVNRAVSDFIDSIKNSQTAATVKYRPFLDSDLTQPQMDAPLELFIADVDIDSYQVTARCRFTDFLNKPFINERFTRARFPSLGD